MGFKPFQHRPVAWLAVACLLLAVAGTSHAAARVALVIGNSAYKNVMALPSARNDAVDLGRFLESPAMGFDVRVHTDLTRSGLIQAVSEFGQLAETADIALVFYAGHAIQVEGRNYILPVDVPQMSTRHDLLNLLDMQVLIDEAGHASRLGIVLLDACRDNPFVDRLRQRSVSASRGLGPIEQRMGRTLVVFATEANRTAADNVAGSGRNSPFTYALLKHLNDPRDVRLMFGAVSDEVVQLTRGTATPQRPKTYGDLGGQEISLVAGTADTSFNAFPYPPPLPVIAPMHHVELTVRPTPADARVRIMNIAPAYRDGIALAADAEYDIEVSAPGYETYRREHHFEAGRRELDVVLNEPRGSADRDALLEEAARLWSQASKPEPELGPEATVIQQLLHQANVGLNSLRLTEPEKDSAYYYYGQVLAIDPNNRAALDGLNEIANRYAWLVERELSRGEAQRALYYLERGFSVRSDHPRLDALAPQVVVMVAQMRAAEAFASP